MVNFLNFEQLENGELFFAIFGAAFHSMSFSGIRDPKKSPQKILQLLEFYATKKSMHFSVKRKCKMLIQNNTNT